MKQPRRRLAVVVALQLTLTAAAAATGEPRAVFPWRARIDADGGPSTAKRVVLPAAVLAAARADLADLRVIDEAGRFVPYAIAPAGDPRSSAVVARSKPVTLVAIDRATDAEGHPRRERLELVVDPVGFQLDRIAFDLPQGDLLVARASVWAVSADAAPRALAEDAPLFRLPGRAHVASIPVPLGLWPRLVIEVRIEQGSWVAPVQVFAERSDAPVVERGELPLEVLATRTDERSTELDLARPPGLSPSAIRIATTSTAFVREVRVRDVGDRELGRGVIARTPDGKVAALTVELAAMGSRPGDLYVAIDDAGEGELDGLQVFAEVPLPSLVVTPFPDVATFVYWGGGRVTTASHRSLESFAAVAPPSGAAGTDSTRWWLALPVVAMAAPEANPRYQTSPAMAFAERPGAPLDTRGWASQRTLSVGPTPEGLAEWTLDADDLAAARPDLGDVRIVDAQDRQISFLLDDPDATESVPIEPALDSRHADPHVSRWRLTVPSGAVPVRAVNLDFAEGFFARNVRLLGTPPHQSEQVLANARLERRVPAAPFRVELAGSPRLGSVVMEVENGDDPALTPTLVSLEVERHRVLFPAPPGPYRGLLGNPVAEPPHYDLAAVRELALGLPAGAAEVGPRTPNPAYRRPGPLSGGSARSVALWVALGVSVLALAVLTLKLVREPPAAPPPGR